MEMRHRFASIATVVDHDAISVFLQSSLISNQGRFEQQMTQQGMVLGLGFRKAGDGFLRDNQEVRRRLRSDIAKCQHQIVFIKNLRRDLPGNNFLEKSHSDVRNGRRMAHDTTKAQPEPDFVAMRQVRR